MCLYTRNREPRIADRDIVVLKYLKKDGEIYKSPIQGTPVTLGKLMVAQPNIAYITYEYTDLYGKEVFSMGGGVIHAILGKSNAYGNYCAKAIIPKGTEYWINSFGTEIAAKQMLITEEEGTNESVDIQLFKEILESAPEKNGIRVGDYQMIDDTFVHPTKKIAKTKVRGIVCGFYKDGSPIICALEMFWEVWDANKDSKVGKHASWDKASSLFNGREVTAKFKKRISGKDEGRFGAFERCINYRKDKKEDWYFGSLGETKTMLDNVVYLNAAHRITGLGFIINTDHWYWSCSEYDSNSSWRCSPGIYRTLNCWSLKSNSCSIVPFYAFKQANTLSRMWKSIIQMFIRK